MITRDSSSSIRPMPSLSAACTPGEAGRDKDARALLAIWRRAGGSERRFELAGMHRRFVQAHQHRAGALVDHGRRTLAYLSRVHLLRYPLVRRLQSLNRVELVGEREVARGPAAKALAQLVHPAGVHHLGAKLELAPISYRDG